MPLQGREIKNRLRSIKNSKKITKAMELVSAAKMRRAVQAALNTRTYAAGLWNIVNRVADPESRFFKAIAAKHITIVVFTSNRGLCGAFNSNVMKRVLALVKQYGRDNVELITVGKKGVAVLNALGIKAEFAYVKDDTAKNTASISEIAAYVTKQYKFAKTDRVVVAYTDYQSAVSQLARVRQLFPLVQTDSISEGVAPVVPDSAAQTAIDYIYEPTKPEVLEYVIPRLAEVQLYQALLESNASEHSARMVAMKSATDAAGEMIDELVLAFNRARQAAITKEIAEISAGTAAVS